LKLEYHHELSSSKMPKVLEQIFQFVWLRAFLYFFSSSGIDYAQWNAANSSRLPFVNEVLGTSFWRSHISAISMGRIFHQSFDVIQSPVIVLHFLDVFFRAYDTFSLKNSSNFIFPETISFDLIRIGDSSHLRFTQ